MKIELKKFTEVTSISELAELTMKSFEIMEKAQEDRESLIIKRLNSFQSEITSFKKEVRGDISELKKDSKNIHHKLNALLNHFKIDPNLLTEE